MKITAEYKPTRDEQIARARELGIKLDSLQWRIRKYGIVKAWSMPKTSQAKRAKMGAKKSHWRYETMHKIVQNDKLRHRS